MFTKIIETGERFGMNNQYELGESLVARKSSELI